VSLSPGDVIGGKYRIERPLGEGGMGQVYVATHGILRKQVALKVMAERFRVDASATERFFREAVAASKVEHPAIVQIFDAGVHDGAPFMAMELLEGEDLDQRLERERRLSTEETLRIARPVLSALEAAHRQGVVHRDIKPPNIFLAKRANGVVTPKVLDFGIAKHVNDPTFDRLTQSGSILGTPLYLSPEQARADENVDHRADIYSIAVTLFHCLAGTTPYEAKNFAELISKMFSQPPRALAELAPDVPPEVCSWIQRSLSRDPDHRPESAAALREGLDEAWIASEKSLSAEAFAKTAPQRVFASA
jgi:serine/threonine-protein kinase